MTKHQLPVPAEMLELMQFKKFELNGKKRRLNSALTIADLRTIAKRRTPKAAFVPRHRSSDPGRYLPRSGGGRRPR